MTFKTAYTALVMPRALDEDTRRREFIFNVLLLALLALSLGAFIMSAVNAVIEAHYKDESPFIILLPSIILLALYLISRRHFRNWLIVAFLSLYIFFGTYALYSYGYVLPEGLLTYALVIVMAGVLLSTRVTLIISAVIVGCLSILAYLQLHHVTKPDTSEQLKVLNVANVILYSLFFAVIILVTWLSNRDINRSLQRARESEKALRAERNSLEVKVMERTQELQQMHLESLNQLQRFAEFGRISSSLLHDLANPLTSATLELDQITGRPTADSLRQVRKSIKAIEAYLDAARRQLRNKSEITTFDAATEIKRVQDFLHSKVRAANVHFKSQLMPAVSLRGDVVRFNQIMANLFANAVDAYELSRVVNKYIVVTMRLTANFVVITVEDRGVGIASQNLPHIFEPFYTTKQADRGIGIGLAVTRQTVETDFGGTITATSVRGKGTCFTVTLPLP